VVLGTFEHYVFEEMGKSGSALFLVLGPDVVPDVDRYQRNGVVLMQEYI